MPSLQRQRSAPGARFARNAFRSTYFEFTGQITPRKDGGGEPVEGPLRHGLYQSSGRWERKRQRYRRT
jgi:hypothetical protein